MSPFDPPALVWFRNDLRLSDHAALQVAVASGRPVIPVYFLSGADVGSPWAAGGASRWWLHQSLAALARSLERLGSRLLLRRGPALEGLKELIRESGAKSVYWHRCYEAGEEDREAGIKAELTSGGVHAETFGGSLLFEPRSLQNSAGEPYRVFTPFWRACRASPAQPAAPIRPPAGQIPVPRTWPASLDLEALGLEPVPDWAGGLREAWRPGEAGARLQLERFLKGALAAYSSRRDLPAVAGTSRLSPHLRFGEVSPREIWHETNAIMEAARDAHIREAGEAFLRQLGWREFSAHLMVHYPGTSELPLRPEYEKLPWRNSARELKAWQRGRTGYPLVDAGMRELWAIGWMHNRVRMVTASFLTKHLMIHWLQGARWFWDTLVDADLANNTFGWQWTAGCGADAAPYFRIFNPVSQGQRFDPAGEYIRRWVPEIAGLPAPWIHKPWEAPGVMLARAGVRLGETYPKPIVDHGKARERALAAYYGLRRR